MRNNVSAGFGFAIVLFVVMIFVSWINNLNYLMDSWSKPSLQIREVVAIVGIPVFPIGVINGGVYLFEDEVSY